MIPDWLESQVTVEQAEADHLVVHERLGPQPVPFGFQNDKWLELKSKMCTGDELWTFDSGGDTWENMCGRAGISLVRDGEIIASITTKLN